MKILVAGAGIGGLALGVAVRRAGLEDGVEDEVEVEVIERADRFTDAGSGLVLAPNGMKALEAIGLGDAVRAVGHVAEPGTSTPFITASGRVLSRVALGDLGVRWGARPVSLARSALLTVLWDAAAAAGVRVRRGAGVTGFRDRGDHVVAALDGGATVSGDALVGADGIRSAVRGALLGDGPPRYSGVSSVRGRAPAPAAYPLGFVAAGRGLQVFAAPIGGGELYWVATINAPAGAWPAKEPAAAHHDLLTTLRRRRWQRPITAMVEAADPGSLLVTDIHDRDPIARWSRGRVTLLGDAAHPMLPTLGQGANIALEDAVVLARHCRGAAPSAASVKAPITALITAGFASYADERAERAARVVRRSRQIARMGQVANPVLAALRDGAMWAMGRLGDPNRQNADLFGWEPAPAVRTIRQ